MNEQYSRLDKDNQLIWNLRDLGHTLRRISEGKGSQKRILIILLETDGLTQKELTARLGVQAGSASEVISKLEAGGLHAQSVGSPHHRHPPDRKGAVAGAGGAPSAQGTAPADVFLPLRRREGHADSSA